MEYFVPYREILLAISMCATHQPLFGVDIVFWEFRYLAAVFYYNCIYELLVRLVVCSKICIANIRNFLRSIINCMKMFTFLHSHNFLPLIHVLILLTALTLPLPPPTPNHSRIIALHVQDIFYLNAIESGY